MLLKVCIRSLLMHIKNGNPRGAIEDCRSVINPIGPTYVPPREELVTSLRKEFTVDTAIFEKKSLQYAFGGRVIILGFTPLNLQEAV